MRDSVIINWCWWYLLRNNTVVVAEWICCWNKIDIDVPIVQLQVFKITVIIGGIFRRAGLVIHYVPSEVPISIFSASLTFWYNDKDETGGTRTVTDMIWARLYLNLDKIVAPVVRTEWLEYRIVG